MNNGLKSPNLTEYVGQTSLWISFITVGLTIFSIELLY